MASCSEIEGYVFRYVNEARKKRGLGTLERSQRLKQIAKSHSQQMAHAKKIWHGHGVHEAGGFAGENCAITHGSNSKSIAKSLHNMWMKSSGHKSNILNSDYSQLGVGVAHSGSGYYATQLFKGSPFGFGGFGFGVSISKKTWKRIGNFVAWWITFGIAIWLANYLSSYVNLSNSLLIALFFGLVIETVSKLSQKIRFKSKFVVNKGFLLWIFIQSLLFLAVKSVFGKYDIVLMSLIFTILVYGIWKLGGKKYRPVKDFIVWWITLTLGVLVANHLIPFIRSPNALVTAILIGFSIETTSKIIQVLRSESKFKVDKYYVLWILILSICYYIALFLMKSIAFRGEFWSAFASTLKSTFSLSQSLWSLILIGLIITIIVHIIWKFKFYNKRVILSIIVLFIILMFLTIGSTVMHYIRMIPM